MSSARALSFNACACRFRRLSRRLTSLIQPRSRLTSRSTSGGRAAHRLLGTYISRSRFVPVNTRNTAAESFSFCSTRLSLLWADVKYPSISRDVVYNFGAASSEEARDQRSVPNFRRDASSSAFSAARSSTPSLYTALSLALTFAVSSSDLRSRFSPSCWRISSACETRVGGSPSGFSKACSDPGRFKEDNRLTG